MIEKQDRDSQHVCDRGGPLGPVRSRHWTDGLLNEKININALPLENTKLDSYFKNKSSFQMN